MSNKTRLQTNNNNLDICIAKANSLPNAGSGGGGFENNTTVCNVTIASDISITGIGYYSLEGHKVINGDGERSWNISVVCGSVIYIIQNGFYSAEANVGEILNIGYGIGCTYRVPSSPTSVTINITTD